MRERTNEKIRLGVSACLLGREVRYDGGHKKDTFLTETLGPFVEWVAVCPEVEIGLGIPRDLVAFHAAQKFAILAHSPAHYGTLGRLVASGPDGADTHRSEAAHGTSRARGTRYNDYGALFMEALAVRATRARHTNVLQHLAGFFKRQLDAPARAELTEVIHEYRRGLVPLVVPLTLIRHYVRRFDLAEIAHQVYLAPHPKELMLRNHV